MTSSRVMTFIGLPPSFIFPSTREVRNILATVSVSLSRMGCGVPLGARTPGRLTEALSMSKPCCCQVQPVAHPGVAQEGLAEGTDRQNCEAGGDDPRKQECLRRLRGTADLGHDDRDRCHQPARHYVLVLAGRSPSARSLPRDDLVLGCVRAVAQLHPQRVDDRGQHDRDQRQDERAGQEVAPQVRSGIGEDRTLHEIRRCEGQAQLSRSHVLVVGAGGLGVPVLQYLAGAGVGKITLVDGDEVAEHNLHRQPLYRMAQIGQPKVEATKSALAALNPEVAVAPVCDLLDPANALALVAAADIVLDCADTFAASLRLSDICAARGKPLITASVLGLSGYVAGTCAGAPRCVRFVPICPNAARPAPRPA